MSNPFVGEIRMVGFNFAPAGWAFCDGSVLPIAENEVLFNLIGTTYGGDGQSTFALPDLRSRVPIHMGTGNGLSTRTLGENGGTESVTLSLQQLPAHNHIAKAQTQTGNQQAPANNDWAASTLNQYSSAAPNALMNAGAITPTGGSQAHGNMLPFLTINFVIALFGVFPSPN